MRVLASRRPVAEVEEERPGEVRHQQGLRLTDLDLADRTGSLECVSRIDT